MRRYSKFETDKLMRRVQRRKDKIAKKDMRLYERDTDKSKVRLPKPFRRPFQAACIVLIMTGMSLTIHFLISGLIVDLWTYATLVGVFVFAPVAMLIYPQAHAADERTGQIQMGDFPPMPAAEHSKGKHTFTMNFEYTDPNDTKMTDKKSKRTFEAMRMGDLVGMWGRTPWPIIGIALTQFGDGDGTPKYSGYKVGMIYHVPADAEAMRFRMFEKIFPSIAKRLKRIRGIGGDITPSTWIIYGFETVSIPEGISQGSEATKNLVLWEAQRRNNLLMGQIHDQAIDDDMYASFERTL